MVMTRLDFAGEIGAANILRKEGKLETRKEDTPACTSSSRLLAKHPGRRERRWRRADTHVQVRSRPALTPRAPIRLLPLHAELVPNRVTFSQVPRGEDFALRLPLKSRDTNILIEPHYLRLVEEVRVPWVCNGWEETALSYSVASG